MKVILVAPLRKKARDSNVIKKNIFNVPPVGLLNVAAITPEDVEIEIVDENVVHIDYQKKTDLVGISVMSASANRAYEIADKFRGLGIPVVLGGTHPSLMFDEAIEHADSIVVGEAEGIWERLLEDFKREGKSGLKKKYENSSKPELKAVPFPRYQIARQSGKYLFTNLLNITRGCPHNCSFCSVTRLLGRKLRLRPINDVVEHIQELMTREDGKKPTLKDRFFIFVDDNIMANKKYAKELFRALIPLKILWVSQTSINSAYDDELLDLAAESGCKGVFVGLESISDESLREIGKQQNKIEFYREGIKKFHKRGIFVEGAFIFGFDNDGTDVFEKTVEFVNEMKLDGVQYTILTPLPGTDFYDKIEKENRFIDRDWTKYDTVHTVFAPKNMNPEQLQRGLYWAYKKTYSLGGILRRTSAALWEKKRWKFFLLLVAFNLGYRRSFKYMFKIAALPKEVANLSEGSLLPYSVRPPSLE